VPKPGKAAQSHRDKHVVDMSKIPPEDRWIPPDPEECEETADYTMRPSEAPSTERIKVRMVDHVPTSALVDFAIVHETFHKGKWRLVAKADSSHDDEVHIHQYSRRTGQQYGGTEQLIPIKAIEDVDAGYYLAYERIVENWAANRARWNDV